MSAPADVRTGVLETTWGKITIAAKPEGVLACGLPSRPAPGLGQGFRVLNTVLPDRAPRWLRSAVDHARAALEGRHRGKPPPVHPAVGDQASRFQRAVWRELQHIPWGQTRTYAEMARRIGSPRAARAVGGACGANPVPLFIPCHRVVAASGLGGFSSGLEWKIHLLAMETTRRDQVAPSGSPARRKSR